MTSLLDDAFAHHIWATERLIDACATLTRKQLVSSTPGPYGSIMATLAHIVSSDAWYLSFFREQPAPIDEEPNVTLTDLRAAITANGAVWRDILAGDPNPGGDLVERADVVGEDRLRQADELVAVDAALVLQALGGADGDLGGMSGGHYDDEFEPHQGRWRWT